MRSDLKRIATQLNARYGSLPGVDFSIDATPKRVGDGFETGIAVHWNLREKGRTLRPGGLMWHGTEEECEGVLQWITRLREIAKTVPDEVRGTISSRAIVARRRPV